MEDPCETCFFKYRCGEICPDGKKFIMMKANLENSSEQLRKLKKALSSDYEAECCRELVADMKQRNSRKVNLFRKPLTFWDKISIVINKLIFNFRKGHKIHVKNV